MELSIKRYQSVQKEEEDNVFLLCLELPCAQEHPLFCRYYDTFAKELSKRMERAGKAFGVECLRTHLLAGEKKSRFSVPKYLLTTQYTQGEDGICVTLYARLQYGTKSLWSQQFCQLWDRDLQILQKSN